MLKHLVVEEGYYVREADLSAGEDRTLKIGCQHFSTWEQLLRSSGFSF